ncbi:hypothetical protein ACQY0O_006359 [Thecaphora frezii]
MSTSQPIDSSSADAEPSRDTGAKATRRRSKGKAKSSEAAESGAIFPSRPANSFILFRRDFNRKYREENPNNNTRSQNISLLASKEWAEAPANVRQRYEELYHIHARIHKEQLAAFEAAAAADAAASVAKKEHDTGQLDATPTGASADPLRNDPGSPRRLATARSKASPYPTSPAAFRGPSEGSKKGRRSLDALQTVPSDSKASLPRRKGRSQSVSSPRAARDDPEALDQHPPLPVGQAVTSTDDRPTLIEGLCKAIGQDKAKKLTESLKRRGWTVPDVQTMAFPDPRPKRTNFANRPSDFGIKEPTFTLRTRNGVEYAELQDWRVKPSFHATRSAPSDLVVPWKVVASAGSAQQAEGGQLSEQVLEQMDLGARESVETPTGMDSLFCAESFGPPQGYPHDNRQHHVDPRDSFYGHLQSQSCQQGAQGETPQHAHPAQPAQRERDPSPQHGSTTENAVIEELLRSIFPSEPKPGLGAPCKPEDVVAEPDRPRGADGIDVAWQAQHDNHACGEALTAFYPVTSAPTLQTDPVATATFSDSLLVRDVIPVSACSEVDPFEHAQAVPEQPQYDESLSEFGVVSDTSLLLTQPFQPFPLAPAPEGQASFYPVSPPRSPTGTATSTHASRRHRHRSRSRSRAKSPIHREGGGKRRSSLSAAAATPRATSLSPAQSASLGASNPNRQRGTTPLPIKAETPQTHNFSRPIPIPAAEVWCDSATTSGAAHVDVPAWGQWALSQLEQVMGPSRNSMPAVGSEVGGGVHPSSIWPEDDPTPPGRQATHPPASLARPSLDYAEPAPATTLTSAINATNDHRYKFAARKDPLTTPQDHPPPPTASSLDDAMMFRRPPSTLAKWAQKASKTSRHLFDRIKSPTIASPSLSPHASTPPSRPLSDSTLPDASTLLPTWPAQPDNAAGRVESPISALSVQDQQTFRLNGEFTAEELLLLAQGRIK